MSRKKIPATVEHALRRLYGGKVCVLTGRDEETRVDWHHLDDNAANNHIANIVPVGAETNQAIERLRHRPDELATDSELALSRLLQISRRRFACGDYAACFGVARLGVWLHRQFTDWINLTQAATQALHATRPLARLDLARDVIQRDLIPIATAAPWNVNGLVSIIAIEMGALYWDYMSIDRATSWNQLAQTTILRPQSKEEVEIHLRLMWKIDALNAVAQRRALLPRDQDLKSVADIRHKGISLTNYRLWAARAAIAARSFDEAQHELRLGLGSFPPLDEIAQRRLLRGGTQWTLAELLATRSELSRLKGSKDADDWGREAWKILRDFRIVPTRMDRLDTAVIHYQEKWVRDHELWVPIREACDVASICTDADHLFCLLITRASRKGPRFESRERG